MGDAPEPKRIGVATALLCETPAEVNTAEIWVVLRNVLVKLKKRWPQDIYNSTVSVFNGYTLVDPPPSAQLNPSKEGISLLKDIPHDVQTLLTSYNSKSNK
jgi:hypothetical protein